MDVQQNASLTPRDREQLFRRAAYEGETPRAVRKWVVRFQSVPTAPKSIRIALPCLTKRQVVA